MDILDKKQRPKLTLPYYPPETESRAFFKNTTIEEKIVREYTGIDFINIDEVGVFDFWRYLHDAVVWNHSSDPEDKYLENAYNFMQTKPDRTGLQELLSSKVVK